MMHKSGFIALFSRAPGIELGSIGGSKHQQRKMTPKEEEGEDKNEKKKKDDGFKMLLELTFLKK